LHIAIEQAQRTEAVFGKTFVPGRIPNLIFGRRFFKRHGILEERSDDA
jgi:hypothetical protein